MQNKFNLVKDILLNTANLVKHLKDDHVVEADIENIEIIATDLGSLGKFYGKNNEFKKLSKYMFHWASTLKGRGDNSELWSLQFYTLKQQAEDIERNERGYDIEELETEREKIEEALAYNTEMREPQSNYGLTNKILRTCGAIVPSFGEQLSLDIKMIIRQKTSLDLFPDE